MADAFVEKNRFSLVALLFLMIAASVSAQDTSGFGTMSDRMEMLIKVLAFLVGLVLIWMVLFFQLYKVMLRKQFRAENAQPIVWSLSMLYSLVLILNLFFHAMDSQIWHGILLLLGVVWLVHFIFAVLVSPR